VTAPTEYDPRYLEGIAHFNRGDFFEAHEAWEELWHDTAGPDRRFYQGLIQAAVAVYHAGNGNDRGARRLFHSGRRYMSGYPSRHRGLDVPAFWAALEAALADFLPDPPPAGATLRADRVPTITLDPAPPSADEPPSGLGMR
jgi:predicted metal-dependent hydrolase